MTACKEGGRQGGFMKWWKTRRLRFVSEKQMLDSELILQQIGTFLNICVLWLLVYGLAHIFVFTPNPFASNLLYILFGVLVLAGVNLFLLISMQKIGRKMETVEIDKLTQLFNRRAFENMMNKEIRRAGRYRYALTLCLLDIDNFRTLNENYGKSRGDEILKRISDLMHRSVRTTDYVGRYQSDEFCILLPHTDLTQGEKFLLRLMAQAEEQIDVSFSAGLTSYHAGENKAQFLIRAKSALEKAKTEGQKKIVGLSTQTQERNAMGL
jgi:diguanylate cyclase (GGDEF)-like protein